MSQLGEILQLGPDTGVVVELAPSMGGMAIFSCADGVATASVYQALDPDVELDNVSVGLIQQQVEGQNTGLYALMVDDPYWGRRIQPAQFAALPLTESFTMGYRLSGQIQNNGVGVSNAAVSFAVTLQTVEDGPVVFWDSEEYNLLVWDDTLGTYVSGSEVVTPVMADAGGNWQYIVPQGDGAPYQRLSDLRDDTPETAAQSLPRYAALVCVAYLGRQLPVVEGTLAILNLNSAQVEISGTPGATVCVGVMEDAGQMYTMPTSGSLTVGNLPPGQVSLVQFMQVSTGEWDPSYGGQRALVAVTEGQSASLDLGPLVPYPTDGSVACGRVFISPGVPAAGAEIVIININNGKLLGTAAGTDGGGFWTVPIPGDGLGGELYILDGAWGSLPVVGLPYSDIVLGARAYSGWMPDFAPAAWRTGTWGHSNFPWVPETVWVVDNDNGTVYPTVPAPYGGWVTVDPLPKWQVLDIPTLLAQGPQLKSYRLVTDHGVEDPDFHLRDQSFSVSDGEPGFFRASGYYPEKKILVGGKLKYNVVLDSWQALDQTWPEAARVGLEFGTYQPFIELRVGAQAGG